MQELLTTEVLKDCGVDHHTVSFFSSWLHGAMPRTSKKNRLTNGMDQIRSESKARRKTIETLTLEEDIRLSQVRALKERIADLRKEIKAIEAEQGRPNKLLDIAAWEKHQVKELFSHSDTESDILQLAPPAVTSGAGFLSMKRRPKRRRDFVNLRTATDFNKGGLKKAQRLWK